MNRNEALAWLERNGSKRNVAGITRYGIRTRRRMFGVPMAKLQGLAKRIGKDHVLATALWTSGCYEAQLLAILVEDPRRLTPRQMNAWVADFDNWGVCDTACFCLFERTAFAWERARRWSKSPREFVKRAGFALMACLAAHDKTATDAEFLALFPLIEQGALDERNFVKKGVNWALRRIGERSPALHKRALVLAGWLARSDIAATRWIGKDALRELSGPKVRLRLARRTKPGRQPS